MLVVANDGAKEIVRNELQTARARQLLLIMNVPHN